MVKGNFHVGQFNHAPTFPVVTALGFLTGTIVMQASPRLLHLSGIRAYKSGTMPQAARVLVLVM